MVHEEFFIDGFIDLLHTINRKMEMLDFNLRLRNDIFNIILFIYMYYGKNI